MLWRKKNLDVRCNIRSLYVFMMLKFILLTANKYILVYQNPESCELSLSEWVWSTSRLQPDSGHSVVLALLGKRLLECWKTLFRQFTFWLFDTTHESWPLWPKPVIKQSDRTDPLSSNLGHLNKHRKMDDFDATPGTGLVIKCQFYTLRKLCIFLSI